MLAADVLQLLEMVVSCEVGAEPVGGLVVTAFRAVSPPGEQRGGGAHRDVPGGRLRAPGGGHHGGTVGQQGLARHHQRVEQESLCPHRGLAEPPLAGRALSIRLRGRHLSAPQLGRRV